MIKLNLGCGPVQPEGWVNVDYSLGARLTRFPFYESINKKFKLFDIGPDNEPRIWDDKILIFDLNKKLPWQNDSVDIIYTSHTLEHFSKEEGLSLLNECHRILKRNGILRIIVPDLNFLINQYNSGKIRADDFIRSLGVLYEGRKSTIKNLLVPLTQFPHKCMYDTTALIEILNSLNFLAVCKDPFESNIPDIRDIELEERTINAVIIEALKK